MTLANYKGKIVLLDFYATWCQLVARKRHTWLDCNSNTLIGVTGNWN